MTPVSLQNSRLSWRAQIAIELAALLVLYFNTLWNLYYLEGHSYAVFASVFAMLALTIYSVFRHWEGWRDFGLRLDNLKEGLRHVRVPLFVIVAGCFAFSLILRTPMPLPKWTQWIEFPLAGLLQQAIFQGFFFNRYEKIFRKTWIAVGLSALTFSLFHLPNRQLMAVTFAGGLYLSYFFSRYRNLFVVALLHGAISLALTTTLEPAGIIKSYKVGPRPMAPMKQFIRKSLEPETKIAQFQPSPGIPGSFETAFDRRVITLTSRDHVEEFLRKTEPVFIAIPKEVYETFKLELQTPSFVWKESLVWLRKFPYRRLRTLTCVLTFNYKQLHEYYRDEIVLISNRSPA